MNVGQLRALLESADPDLELAVIVDGSGELRRIVDLITDDEPIRIVAAAEPS